MTEFWLVRHGQTLWNVEGRSQGSIDIELNECGLSQARLAAQQLKTICFEAVYSSPLKRAYRTAEIIAAECRTPVQVDCRLAELSMGVWEGMLFSEILQHYPTQIAERETDPLHARAPGGETVLELCERMAQAAADIATAHPLGPVLIVSHGLALAVLLCVIKGIPLEDVYNRVPENADPVRVTWSPVPGG